MDRSDLEVLVPLFLPLLAWSWLSWGVHCAIAFLPALRYAILLETSGGYSFFGLVFTGVTAAAGAAARASSLLARRFGHRRPRSFWIEILVVGLTLGWLASEGFF